MDSGQQLLVDARNTEEPSGTDCLQRGAQLRKGGHGGDFVAVHERCVVSEDPFRDVRHRQVAHGTIELRRRKAVPDRIKAGEDGSMTDLHALGWARGS